MRFRIKAILPLTFIALISCEQINCPIIPGIDPFLQPGQVILAGEIHGTLEGPEFVRTLACNALQKELRVTIGLELPQNDQERLDEFLESNGSVSAKKKFLDLNFWARDYQDGRASLAMFHLIEDVRTLRALGASVDIFFIDKPGDRDYEMAQRVIEEVESYPNNLFIILTGNQHNIISARTGKMGAYIVEKIDKERVLSLDQGYAGGSAWVCVSGGECGAIGLRGNGESGSGILLFEEGMSNYNGIFRVDSIHASLPARKYFQ